MRIIEDEGPYLDWTGSGNFLRGTRAERGSQAVYDGLQEALSIKEILSFNFYIRLFGFMHNSANYPNTWKLVAANATSVFGQAQVSLGNFHTALKQLL